MAHGIRIVSVVIAASLLVAGCSSGRVRHSKWDDIDYSKIARQNQENDTNYTQPNVRGCVDDDLYNCR